MLVSQVLLVNFLFGGFATEAHGWWGSKYYEVLSPTQASEHARGKAISEAALVLASIRFFEDNIDSMERHGVHQISSQAQS